MLYLIIALSVLAFFVAHYMLTLERNAWKRASKHNYGLFHASQERLHSAEGDLHSAEQDLELASADLTDAEKDLAEVVAAAEKDLAEVEADLAQALSVAERRAEQLHAAEIDAKYWKAKADEFRDLIPDEEITEITAVLEVPAVPPPLPKGAKKPRKKNLWKDVKNKHMSPEGITAVAIEVTKEVKKINKPVKRSKSNKALWRIGKKAS